MEMQAGEQECIISGYSAYYYRGRRDQGKPLQPPFKPVSYICIYPDSVVMSLRRNADSIF